jgi:hypothetical protein
MLLPCISFLSPGLNFAVQRGIPHVPNAANVAPQRCHIASKALPDNFPYNLLNRLQQLKELCISYQ